MILSVFILYVRNIVVAYSKSFEVFALLKYAGSLSKVHYGFWVLFL